MYITDKQHLTPPPDRRKFFRNRELVISRMAENNSLLHSRLSKEQTYFQTWEEQIHYTHATGSGSVAFQCYLWPNISVLLE
jgi:diaminopimelate epimerase